MLPAQALPFDADFFTDLGGHSLLAARFVSVVRETPALAGITLQDMYRARSLRAIAALVDGAPAAGGPRIDKDLRFTPPPFRRRFLCGLAQAAALPFILSLTTAQWLGVFVSYMLLTGSDATFLEEAVSLVSVYMVINIATVLFAIAAKWLILGRMKPGRYPLWGTYFFRWWLVQRLISLTHPKWFQGSPVMRLFLIALGAKVGVDAVIGDHEVGAADLLEIGAGASIGGKVQFANARVEGNEFIVGRIAIGADCLCRHLLRHRGGRGDRRGHRTRRSHNRRVRQQDRERRDLGRIARAPRRHGRSRRAWSRSRWHPRRAVWRRASPTRRCCSSFRRLACCRSFRPSGCSTSSMNG